MPIEVMTFGWPRSRPLTACKIMPFLHFWCTAWRWLLWNDGNVPVATSNCYIKTVLRWIILFYYVCRIL